MTASHSSDSSRWKSNAIRGFNLLCATATLGVFAMFAFNHWTSPAGTPPALDALLMLLSFGGPAWLLLSQVRSSRARMLPWVAMIMSGGAFLLWLTIDDAEIRYPTNHPALQNDFPDAAASYQLTLRYNHRSPNPDKHPPTVTPLTYPSLYSQPDSREKWLLFVRENQSTIETQWDEAKPLLSWFSEMADAEALADMTNAFHDPLPDFQAIRTAMHAISAQATLLAIDEKGDEAIRTLLPLLSVGEKLETHSRTLVRRMIAIVIQRHTLAAIDLVLDHNTLSESTRADLTRVLESADDPEKGARLLLLCEHDTFRDFILGLNNNAAADLPIDTPTAHRGTFGLFYNPVRTANLYGEYMHAGAEALARRNLIEIKRLNDHWHETNWLGRPGKNHVGRLLLNIGLPAYGKIAESYWDTHDRRQALLARL